MIGRETRVLLRHYLEQGMSKAAIARQVGVSRRTVYRWIVSGQLDRELDNEPVRYGGYSRYQWLQYYERQTMKVVMRGLEAAFGHFRGIPAEMLFDQMKAVVIDDERADGGRLIANGEFLRFAGHWGFRIRACRPCRAQTKGKVERQVSYVRRNFFYGRDFVSDADLNAQALRWLDTVANVRIHGTLKERPADRFEAERPHLQPLAPWPYRSAAPQTADPAPGADGSRFPPLVEVERRSLDDYARIAGGVR